VQSFQTAAAQLGARGAAVVLVTSPYFDKSWHDPTQEWPEFAPARVDALNAAIRQVAAASGGAIKLIDLNAYVSPGGRFTDTLDGVHIRDDGVHFTIEGAAYVSKWLAPQLRAIGLEHPRDELERRVRYDDRGNTR
jgi:lysophospholipase L1-like esterase